MEKDVHKRDIADQDIGRSLEAIDVFTPQILFARSLMLDNPEYNPAAVQAVENIIEKANKLSGVRQERLRQTAVLVLRGITYDAVDLYAENAELPAFIDRYDLHQRGGRSQQQAYHQVLSTLRFKPATVTRMNDHGMRVTETTYLSPLFTKEETQVAIIELMQRTNDITLFAEIQPYLG